MITSLQPDITNTQIEKPLENNSSWHLANYISTTDVLIVA
jgi:hypothetical protein